MAEKVFPKQDWETISPKDVGFSPEKLKEAKTWLDDHLSDGRYRVVIVRGGRIAAEWNHNVDRDARFGNSAPWNRRWKAWASSRRRLARVMAT